MQAVTPEQVERLSRTHGMLEMVGPAGTVVMFTGQAVHGSEENRSSRPRCVAYFAYSRTDNRPTTAGSKRQHVSTYQLNRDPVELDDSVDDDALLRLAEVTGPQVREGALGGGEATALHAAD